MTDLTVYRSRDPRVLAVIESFEAEQKEWTEKAKSLLADLGFVDRNWMVTHHSYGMSITGVGPRESDNENPPTGWRLVDRGGLVLTPDKRRKSGKEAQARIDACRPPEHPRVRLPGMPPSHFGPGHIYYPNLSEHGDGAIYVEWSTRSLPEIPAGGQDGERSRHGVYLAIWARVKLSEYYAVLEAEEAKAS